MKTKIVRVVDPAQQRAPARVPAPAVVEAAGREQRAQPDPVDRRRRAREPRGRVDREHAQATTANHIAHACETPRSFGISSSGRFTPPPLRAAAAACSPRRRPTARGGDEVAQDGGEALRVLVERVMARVREELQPGVGDEGVRGDPVRCRDHRVTLAPDDQRRHALSKIEAIGRAHPLARRIDDRACGVEEGAARPRVAQRREPERRSTHVGVRAQADPAHQRAGEPGDLARPPSREQREHPLGTGQRRRAEHPPDLLAQAAARHEREALDALGELVGELHRDPAAHRVADDGRALVPERGHQVAQPVGVGAERVVAARLGRAAVAEQVRRDDGVPLGQRRDHLAPGVRARGDPVDEQHDRSGPRRGVRDGVAVQAQLVPLQDAHAACSERAGTRRGGSGRPAGAASVGDGGEAHERPRVEADDRERDGQHDRIGDQGQPERARLRLALQDLLVAHERAREVRRRRHALGRDRRVLGQVDRARRRAARPLCRRSIDFHSP